MDNQSMSSASHKIQEIGTISNTRTYKDEILKESEGVYSDVNVQLNETGGRKMTEGSTITLGDDV